MDNLNPIQYILHLLGVGNSSTQSTHDTRAQQIANSMKLTYGNSAPLGAEAVSPQQVPQPTANPLAIAQQMTQQSPSSDGFKFQMGQHDYSSLAPQVQSVLKGSPLEPYANNFIEAGNRHGVDPRVLITIANNESTLGRNYPQDTYNPFGYDVRSGGMIQGKDGKMYVNVDQGLKNAGFTSLPMAIDRLTQRFSDHPVNATPQGYANFRQDPTISNLQQAYNSDAGERANYLKNAIALVNQFQNK